MNTRTLFMIGITLAACTTGPGGEVTQEVDGYVATTERDDAGGYLTEVTTADGEFAVMETTPDLSQATLESDRWQSSQVLSLDQFRELQDHNGWSDLEFLNRFAIRAVQAIDGEPADEAAYVACQTRAEQLGYHCYWCIFGIPFESC